MNLTDTQKKILFAAGILAVAAAFGFLVYYLFFKAPAEEYVNVNGEQVPISVFPEISLNLNKGEDLQNINGFVGLPEIDSVASGGKTLTETVVGEQTQDAILAGNGQDIQYYNAEEGKFYRVDEEGNVVQISDEIFKGVEKVNWSNDSNEAVLEFEDGYNLYYDFENGKQYTLPKEMEDFTFSPTDDKLGFKYMAIDKEDKWLGTINPDGTNVQGIERLGDNEDQVQVNWSPSGKAIGTFKDYIDGDRQKVIPLGLHGENFKQMTVEGRDFNYEWSPTGEKMLYSVFGDYSDLKPALWVVDAEGDAIGANRVQLELNTWVDKCTFASKNEIYCAVPETLPTGIGFARELANDIPDNIYKIDLDTGKQNLVAVPTNISGTSQYTMDSLYVSDDGSSLYFTDVSTGNVNKINLK